MKISKEISNEGKEKADWFSFIWLVGRNESTFFKGLYDSNPDAQPLAFHIIFQIAGLNRSLSWAHE